ncbi:MAG: winged helix-turn-helix transcriptional regulator, partial [Staphylothermus sp.]|nr:winged helix-turn-helix transcriptional regulator [Staphylothermus sp.]
MVFVSHYKIVLVTNDEGIIDPRYVSEKLGLSISTVKKYIKILVSEGFITYENGLFKLTEKGEILKKSLLKLKNKEKQEINPYVVTDPESGNQLPL